MPTQKKTFWEINGMIRERDDAHRMMSCVPFKHYHHQKLWCNLSRDVMMNPLWYSALCFLKGLFFFEHVILLNWIGKIVMWTLLVNCTGNICSWDDDAMVDFIFVVSSRFILMDGWMEYNVQTEHVQSLQIEKSSRIFCYDQNQNDDYDHWKDKDAI